ncbi:MAG: pilin [bacterium]|nr:pilin [bacterium]
MNAAQVPGVLQLQEIIQRVISLMTGLAFLALTVMLVVGGIKYLTSGGEPKAISSASNTLTWALLGMLFLALAWIILRLIEAFTGVPVTQFCIGFPGGETKCP